MIFPEAFALLAAPLTGSLLSVLVVRLPTGEPWVWGRSRCRSCDTSLGARDLIPLLSWALARGQCRHCSAPVSALYPALELGGVVVALMALLVASGWDALILAGVGWTLLAIAVTNARTFTIPDSLSLPLIPLGILYALAQSGDAAFASLIGALAGGLFLYLVAKAFERLRGHPMLSMGDVKLFAAAGAWAGWMGLPFVLLAAAMSGLVAIIGWALWKRALPAPTWQLPFGALLAAGVWVVLLLQHAALV